jgi:hypothetical protein
MTFDPADPATVSVPAEMEDVTLVSLLLAGEVNALLLVHRWFAGVAGAGAFEVLNVTLVGRRGTPEPTLAALPGDPVAPWTPPRPQHDVVAAGCHACGGLGVRPSGIRRAGGSPSAPRHRSRCR